MSKVIAVIGSGYGDEGKGLMTDYYASKYEDAIVVRSNGGAQAGHTVTTPTGERKVFSHFGSGSFNGTPTYLSDFFVTNPMLFEKEHRAFVKEFGIVPKIYINPYASVTTPYEMLINQAQELIRGGDLHGSVGVGFGETLERELVYRTWLVDDIQMYFEGNWNFIDHMKNLRDEYVPTRVDLNKLDNKTFNEILNNEQLIDDFIKACEYMLEHTEVSELNLPDYETVIFEGAQGLLLDMDYGYFPHVTRSNCGMKNISKILDRSFMGDMPEDITVNYVTRAYTTRHGAGPLDREDVNMRMEYSDSTNLTNEWQGTLRYAPLNLDLFNSITDKDFLNYAPRWAKKATTMTCLDQLTKPVTWIAKGRDRRKSAEIAQQQAGEMFDFGSFGPTRDDVKEF